MNKLDFISKIKKFKLGFLQYRYKYLSNIIFKLEKHIDNLYNNNYIELSLKNQMLGNIFIISKNLTSTYNNYIIEKLDNISELDNKIYLFMYNLIQNNIDETFLFDQFLPLIKNDSKILPLYDDEVDIKNVISYIGYENLHDLIQLYDIKNDLTQSQQKLIIEINKVFIPIKTNYFQVINHF